MLERDFEGHAFGKDIQKFVMIFIFSVKSFYGENYEFLFDISIPLRWLE